MQEQAISSSAEKSRASPIKEKRLGRFPPLALPEQIRAVRDLQRARQREVPRAGFARVSDKRKTPQRFSSFDFIERFRAVRRNRERIDKRKTARPFFASRLTQSKSEQWSFAVHPCTAHYRIFASQKYVTVLRRCDTASVPCIERSSPRHLQRAH